MTEIKLSGWFITSDVEGDPSYVGGPARSPEDALRMEADAREADPEAYDYETAVYQFSQKAWELFEPDYDLEGGYEGFQDYEGILYTTTEYNAVVTAAGKPELVMD